MTEDFFGMDMGNLDVIKGIYGEKHFLDIANLQELPNKLMGLIARLLK